ncbi:hypothetical protein [Vibrio parahaemolyticus]|uniref:hypothetical protein n=1 Tax=Vibrio parahaemolyticus TaxID=670 RepID=UPI0030EB1539
MEEIRERAAKVIEEYNLKKHVRGTRDCNLMALKVFDPKAYEAMYQTYSTIKGGVKASLLVGGVRSMKEYLIKKEFEEIPKGFEAPLDVIVFDDKHDVYLCLGRLWFGVITGDVFGMFEPDKEGQTYRVFRRRI